MKKVNLFGHEVTTNCGENYSFDKGNGRATMTLCLQNFGESDDEMLRRLAKQGYKKIMFFLVTTNIRGYYNVIAYCK